MFFLMFCSSNSLPSQTEKAYSISVLCTNNCPGEVLQLYSICIKTQKNLYLIKEIKVMFILICLKQWNDEDRADHKHEIDP